MDAPRIQYAKSADGVSIAFWALGKGTPLLSIPSPPFNHLQLEWQIPELRRFYQRLATGRMLVRYDNRGCGLSQRDVEEYSLAALVSDTHAVAEQLGVASFDLLGSIHSGPVAIAYAALHPERVRHLVLWCTYARGADYQRPPRSGAIHDLVDKDWELYAETSARYLMGYAEEESPGLVAVMIRESSTPEVQRAFTEAVWHLDVEADLAQVKAPTLIIHRRQVRYPVQLARKLAAEIPGARLVLLEGTSSTMALEDPDAVARAIDEFLADGEAATAPSGTDALPSRGRKAGASRTIMYTDIEGNTDIQQRLGDDAWRAVLRDHERITRDMLRAHNGTEVKTMGDGFMASFDSATSAVECAIDLQRSFGARNEAASEPVLVRVGLNAGEPIEEDDDLFGTAVTMAARIMGQGAGGEILVSDLVRGLVAGKDFIFADRGEFAAKGFDEPVRVYEVRWRDG